MNFYFDSHISNIPYKISRTVEIISKIRYYLLEKALLIVYYAQIHFYLLYSLIIWESTFPIYFKKLTTLQNNAVKCIGAAKFCHSALPYYNRGNILKLTDLHKFEVGKFVQANF